MVSVFWFLIIFPITQKKKNWEEEKYTSREKEE
jgi:hypothetical protein